MAARPSQVHGHVPAGSTQTSGGGGEVHAAKQRLLQSGAADLRGDLRRTASSVVGPIAAAVTLSAILLSFEPVRRNALKAARYAPKWLVRKVHASLIARRRREAGRLGPIKRIFHMD